MNVTFLVFYWALESGCCSIIVGRMEKKQNKTGRQVKAKLAGR